MTDLFIVQSEFDRLIDKVIAELQVAKLHGWERAEPALGQAVYHLSLVVAERRLRAQLAAQTTKGEPA